MIKGTVCEISLQHILQRACSCGGCAALFLILYCFFLGGALLSTYVFRCELPKVSVEKQVREINTDVLRWCIIKEYGIVLECSVVLFGAVCVHLAMFVVKMWRCLIQWNAMVAGSRSYKGANFQGTE